MHILSYDLTKLILCVCDFGLIWLGVCSRFSRVCSRFGSSGKQKWGWLPEFVPILFVLVNKSGDDCLCLFMFWVEWETKAGMVARVCLRFGSSGKQMRGWLPVFVYVLGRVGNKSVNTCPSLFMFWVEWETKVGMIACVCSHFGSDGKQTRGRGITTLLIRHAEVWI